MSSLPDCELVKAGVDPAAPSSHPGTDSGDASGAPALSRREVLPTAVTQPDCL